MILAAHPILLASVILVSGSVGAILGFFAAALVIVGTADAALDELDWEDVEGAHLEGRRR